MTSTASLALDKAFLLIVREVERGYQLFSKQQRLRIEKWVEKLVTSSVDNYVWRRHRNEYAKLLLHMVILRRLGDPFHQCPPDGPLAQFPKHLTQYHLRDKASDSHEISFWKEIYQRLGDRQSRLDLSSTSKFTDSLEPFPNDLTNDLPLDRELKYLKINDGEHKLRIDLLEQQLRDEKLHYALQIQSLESAHRMEVSAYAEAIAATSMYSNNMFNRSMTSPCIIEPLKNMDRDESISQRSTQGTLPQNRDEILSMDSTDRSTGHFLRHQRHHNSQKISSEGTAKNNNRNRSSHEANDFFPSNSPEKMVYSLAPTLNDENRQESRRKNPADNFKVYDNGLGYKGYDSPHSTFENSGRLERPMKSVSNILDDDDNYSQISSTIFAKQNKSNRDQYQTDEKGGTSIFGDLDSTNNAPNTNQFFPSRKMDNGNSSISAIAVDISMKDISRNVDFTIADVRQSKPLKIRQYDDDFLAYIDEFQSEIRKLQTSSPLRKSRIML